MVGKVIEARYALQIDCDGSLCARRRRVPASRARAQRGRRNEAVEWFGSRVEGAEVSAVDGSRSPRGPGVQPDRFGDNRHAAFEIGVARRPEGPAGRAVRGEASDLRAFGIATLRITEP